MRYAVVIVGLVPQLSLLRILQLWKYRQKRHNVVSKGPGVWMCVCLCVCGDGFPNPDDYKCQGSCRKHVPSRIQTCLLNADLGRSYHPVWLGELIELILS